MLFYKILKKLNETNFKMALFMLNTYELKTKTKVL